MNNTQRKILAKVAADLRKVKDQTTVAFAKTTIENACSVVQDVLDDEQDKYDNLSEGQQYGVIGERLMDAINELEPIVEFLEQELYDDPLPEDYLEELNDCADQLETI